MKTQVQQGIGELRGLCRLGIEHHFFELLRRFGTLVLLLLMATFDHFAQGTGMLAIKGLAQRFDERSLLRMAHEHACPGRGLKQRPMPAHGNQQGEDKQQMSAANEHESPFLEKRLCAGKLIFRPCLSIHEQKRARIDEGQAIVRDGFVQRAGQSCLALKECLAERLLLRGRRS